MLNDPYFVLDYPLNFKVDLSHNCYARYRAKTCKGTRVPAQIKGLPTLVEFPTERCLECSILSGQETIFDLECLSITLSASIGRVLCPTDFPGIYSCNDKTLRVLRRFACDEAEQFWVGSVSISERKVVNNKFSVHARHYCEFQLPTEAELSKIPPQFYPAICGTCGSVSYYPEDGCEVVYVIPDGGASVIYGSADGAIISEKLLAELADSIPKACRIRPANVAFT